MSKFQNDDTDSNSDDVHQVEISHGSTTDQTSIYASSSVALERCNYCCDVILIILFFLSFVLTLLFSFELITPIVSYFQKHYDEHVIVLTVGILLTVVFFLVTVVRCTRRSDCYKTSELVCYKRTRGIPSGANVFHNDETDDGIPSSKQATGNLKINELTASELTDVKRILTKFLNHHEEIDWSFSPSSRKSFSETNMFYSSNPFTKVCDPAITFTIKVVLIGPPNVGKTSVFHRILYDRFTEYYMATLGVDLGQNVLHIFPTTSDHLMINLMLWDIAGSDSMSALVNVYNNVTSFMMISDVTDSDYSQFALPWIKDIKSLVFDPHISIFLNKIDLSQQKQLSTYEVHMTDELSPFDSYLVSAKTGEGLLENLVIVLAKSILHEIGKVL